MVVKQHCRVFFKVLDINRAGRLLGDAPAVVVIGSLCCCICFFHQLYWQ